MKKHFSLVSVLLMMTFVCAYADIDMQAHVASDEGKAAYTTYRSKQSAYYTGDYSFSAMIAQTGNTLFGTINTLMGNTCNNGSGFSYDKLKNNFIKVDKDLNNSSNIIGYYDGRSMNGEWDSGTTWNREHTWPQSKFKGSNSNGTSLPIGYDMQSVRPASSKVNSSRGNTAYGEGTDYYDPNEISINNSAYKSINNGTYRGDCARVILYDYVVYGKWGSYSNDLYRESVTADLLTQIGTNSNSVFESLAILLKWHMQDPPSLTEMVRNDGGQDYQGNRNIFIDYPELAINMLKDQSGVTAYSVSYSMTATASPAYVYTTPAGFVCYLSESDGSHPSSVTVTGATSNYNASLGRLTITNVSGNVTISAAGASTTPYSVTLWRNGSKTTVSNLTGTYALPTDEAAACTGWNFAGWSTTQVSSTTTKPTFVTSVNSEATLYAVYSQTTAGSGGGSSDTQTLDISNLGYVNATAMSTETLSNATLTFSKGAGNNDPAYYTGAVRMYSKNTLTITSSSTITVVEFTTSQGGSDVSVDSGTLENKKWTGSASSVVFTNNSTSQWRITLISVTTDGGGTATTYATSPDCTPVTPTCTLNAISVNTDAAQLSFTVGETFKSDGIVVTASYSGTGCSDQTVDNWTASSPDMSVAGNKTIVISYSEGSITKTASYNISVTVPVTYTVTWSVDGTVTQQQYNDGDPLTTPTAPADCSTDKVFVGWTASSTVDGSEPSDLFESAYGTIVQDDMTFYAVFATNSGSGSTGNGSQYEKVTTAPDDWAGNYLIVNEEAKKAFNGLSAQNAVADVSIENGVIAGTDELAADEVIIASMGEGNYSLQVSAANATNNAGKYLSGTADQNKMNFVDEPQPNTISIANGEVIITSNTSVLRYNPNGGQPLFRYYKATSTSFQLVQLFKKTVSSGGSGSQVTYSDYTLTCEDAPQPQVYYTITIADSEHGTVETEPVGSAVAGATVTIFPMPDNGYKMTSVIVADADNNAVAVSNNSFTMPASNVTITGTFAKAKVYELKTWGEFDANDETIITMTREDGSVFALYNANGTSKAPTAVAVTVENNKIETAEADIYWNLMASDNDATQFSIHYPGDVNKWLYFKGTSANGVRVGNDADNKLWKVVDNGEGYIYLQHVATERYLGVYNAQDWRTYPGTTGTSNIKQQTLNFYVRTIAGTDIGTEAEMLSSNQSWLNVKGNMLVSTTGQPVSIYNVAGQRVAVFTDRFALDGLAVGVYVITNGSQSVKLVR